MSQTPKLQQQFGILHCEDAVAFGFDELVLVRVIDVSTLSMKFNQTALVFPTGHELIIHIASFFHTVSESLWCPFKLFFPYQAPNRMKQWNKSQLMVCVCMVSSVSFTTCDDQMATNYSEFRRECQTQTPHRLKSILNTLELHLTFFANDQSYKVSHCFIMITCRSTALCIQYCIMTSKWSNGIGNSKYVERYLLFCMMRNQICRANDVKL